MKRRRTIRAALLPMTTCTGESVFADDCDNCKVELNKLLISIRRAVESQLPDLHRPELTRWARELE